jgi:hypothetical protein
VHCAVGSWGDPRRSMRGHVMGTGATKGGDRGRRGLMLSTLRRGARVGATEARWGDAPRCDAPSTRARQHPCLSSHSRSVVNRRRRCPHRSPGREPKTLEHDVGNGREEFTSARARRTEAIQGTSGTRWPFLLTTRELPRLRASRSAASVSTGKSRSPRAQPSEHRHGGC